LSILHLAAMKKENETLLLKHDKILCTNHKTKNEIWEDENW